MNEKHMYPQRGPGGYTIMMLDKRGTWVSTGIRGLTIEHAKENAERTARASQFTIIWEDQR